MIPVKCIRLETISRLIRLNFCYCWTLERLAPTNQFWMDVKTLFGQKQMTHFDFCMNCIQFWIFFHLNPNPQAEYSKSLWWLTSRWTLNTYTYLKVYKILDKMLFFLPFIVVKQIFRPKNLFYILTDESIH